MDLAGCSAFLRVLSDPTRVRLLALIEREELTVAELAAVTRLAQPRVSTHLAKLKELALVRDRRAGDKHGADKGQRGLRGEAHFKYSDFNHDRHSARAGPSWACRPTASTSSWPTRRSRAAWTGTEAWRP
mgnify:CR=1 FL=1